MCPGNNPYSGGSNINPFGTMNNRPIKTGVPGANPYGNAGGGTGGIDTVVGNDENAGYAQNNPYAKNNSRNAPQDQYLRQRVETASKGELILMLFEGCCKFMYRADKAFDLKENAPTPELRIAQIEEINTNLIKAQNILLELMGSLNFDYDISHKLYPVYNYVYKELVRINYAKNKKGLEPLIKIMEGYCETWKEVLKKDRQNQYSGGQDGSLV
ncbi:MAG: flagellar export chaperone FliS [Oscillospiraceae bacterium]|nr:flagellar export chaperone FliS [Oscillospiraceae bacterium]